jgi:hypothetical protein
MNLILIHSDGHVIRSDGYPESFFPRAAQTSPPHRARLTADRTRSARHIGRDIQAVRSAELPLRRRTWPWAQAISVDQSTWDGRPAAQRLCAKRHPRAGRPFDWQFPCPARCARRDLCDQHGTLATTRGTWINRHGPGTRRFRLRQGGRHPRRHGCVLSCRRRPAVQSGGVQCQ